MRRPILLGSHGGADKLEIAPTMFGIAPHWADLKLARQTYNARTETVASKPSFRNVWKRKQFCIIQPPISSNPTMKPASPRADGGPVAVAGMSAEQGGIF